MLRNLSNADREGGDGSEARGESRVGTKSASRKLNIANTIEVNVSNINAAKVERVQSTDPIFLKMNKALDDSGAKGMLMANLVSNCMLSKVKIFPHHHRMFVLNQRHNHISQFNFSECHLRNAPCHSHLLKFQMHRAARCLPLLLRLILKS